METTINVSWTHEQLEEAKKTLHSLTGYNATYWDIYNSWLQTLYDKMQQCPYEEWKEEVDIFINNI